MYPIQQRILNKLADTHKIILVSTRRILTRGQDIEDAEKKSEEIMQTSMLFMFKVVPWYSRWYHYLKKKLCICPAWWFSCFSSSSSSSLGHQTRAQNLPI